MIDKQTVRAIPIVVLLLVCFTQSFHLPVFAEESYSPYVDHPHYTNLYWGDTHLHTNLSVDANGMGNRKRTPDDAYRFAKGEVIIAHNGMKTRLHRPLDFLVIADHAVNMGVMTRLAVKDSLLLKTAFGKSWYEKFMESPRDTGEVLTAESEDVFNEGYMSTVGTNAGSFIWDSWANLWSAGFTEKAEFIKDKSFRRSVWSEVAENADRHNAPGKFTAFSGYEWTPMEPAGYHRVVIFKDEADKVKQVLPFAYHDGNDPERLWAYLSEYEKKTGGEAFAIPHNGNVTNGLMFPALDFNGMPLSAHYAKVRSRWEPLYEVTQIKGDGETQPVLSPDDEFADYETWNSLAGWTMEGVDTEGWEKRKQHEYARSALQLGLSQQAKLGINPFKFGMIGSTDSHTSFATADENNFWGKMSYLEPTKHRMLKTKNGTLTRRYAQAASGYAAVWAEENTRESLFAAMKRKETYATTGPRMTVRFFGGWEYETDDAQKTDLAKIGYGKGVPMGGDLASAPKGKEPSFLIRAVKDPDGANLDRVQVIKGWHDRNGELHEKIYNVALSDGRHENRRGNVKPVGNTVDVKDASYVNSIGDPELAVVWTDPDFNENELAFYYVRVLEIPTPRWTAYDAKFFGVEDIPDEIPMVTQERAYTSPIWYVPTGRN